MRRKGFTLIELIIVVIIIGILAAIAAPMMQTASRKAIASEAVSVLGTVRNAIRAYYVEHDRHAASYEELGFTMNHGGAGRSDLGGTYFSDNCYADNFAINAPRTADPQSFLVGLYFADASNTAPKAAVVASWTDNTNWGYICMDETGRVYSDYTGLGYLPYPDF